MSTASQLQQLYVAYFGRAADPAGLDYWVAKVGPGTILFEIEGLDHKQAQEAFRKCSNKLPIKTKTVARRPI